MRAVFDQDRVLSHLRQVQAIVKYLEQFPQVRAEYASSRARATGDFSYRGIKRTLTEGVDLALHATERGPLKAGTEQTSEAGEEQGAGWLSWRETRDLLRVSDELLHEFWAEGLLHPGHEALRPFDPAEIENLLQLLQQAGQRDGEPPGG